MNKVLLILLIPTVLGIIEECENKEDIYRKEECYVNRAQNASDCEILLSSTQFSYDDCIEKVYKEYYDISQCENVPTKFRKGCSIELILRNSTVDVSVCYQLNQTFQYDCIKEYIYKHQIQELEFCYQVKPELQKHCAIDIALQSLSSEDINRQDCDNFTGDIRAGCLFPFEKKDSDLYAHLNKSILFLGLIFVIMMIVVAIGYHAIKHAVK